MSKKRSKNTQQQELKGLGDVVEKVAKKTRAKKVVKKIFDKLGMDCGCDKRRDKLNELFPFKHTPKCMREEDYSNFKTIRGNKKLTDRERNVLANIHAYLFNHKFHLPCNCSPKVWARWMREVETVYSSYESKPKV